MPPTRLFFYKGSEYQLRFVDNEYCLDRGTEGLHDKDLGNLRRYNATLNNYCFVDNPIPHELLKATELYLQNDLGLDWETFCGSVLNG